MGVGRELGGDLLTKCDADSQRIRPGGSERAVVESFTSTEAGALTVEAKTGAKNDSKVPCGNDRQVSTGLGNSEGPGFQLFWMRNVMENERLAIDSGQNPAVPGNRGDQFQQGRLTGQGGETGDAGGWLIAEKLRDLSADELRLPVGIGNVGEDSTEPGAPLGFSRHRIRTCLLHCHLSGGSISSVIRLWQVVLLMLALGASAKEEKKAFVWKAPKTGAGLFSDDLGMLDREREEYATNLAVHASNGVANSKASAASLEEARRLIALSLHLAPRNKRALVAKYQLERGVMPEVVESEYSPEVLARLLFTRGQILRQQGGEENLLLSRVFTELAAEMDSKNEDAVYASELQRLDHGRVEWLELTDVKSAAAGKKPE